MSNSNGGFCPVANVEQLLPSHVKRLGPRLVNPSMAPIRIGVVLTGGTAGSVVSDGVIGIPGDSESNGAQPLILDYFPETLRDGTPIEYVVIEPVKMLSENMDPQAWREIAAAVRELEALGATRIVGIHGTDTAEYTAPALSFQLRDLWRRGTRLVVTCSNDPAGEPGSDFPTNVDDAVNVVADPDLPPGAHLSFSGCPGRPSLVHRGTAVRKCVGEDGLFTFASTNGRPVGEVVNGRFRLTESPDASRWLRRPVFRDELGGRCEPVLSIKLHPLVNLEDMADLVRRKGYRGVVLEMYPTGTGSDKDGPQSVPQFVGECAKAGAVVVTTTPEVPARRGKPYSSKVAIQAAGAIAMDHRLSPGMAVVKLGHALGLLPQGFSKPEPLSYHVRQMMRHAMETDWVGELQGVGMEWTGGRVV